MPLYMDIHKFDEITIADVKKAHQYEKSIQDQYGVKYHQFWVNEKEGFVFCLVEGPDKEACRLVHQYAHGFVACNIVEVEPGFFKLLMGDGQPVEHGLVQNDNGLPDPGYRHIMVIEIRAKTNITRSEDYKHLWMPYKCKNLALDRVARFNGRVVEINGDEGLVGVFNTAVNAVRCAKDLQYELKERKKNSPDDPELNVSFRMGLFTGHPLTEDAGFFTRALVSARRLCLTANENEVLVSSRMNETCTLEDTSQLRPLTNTEESFINELFELTEPNLPDKDFNVDQLSRTLGVSRPQLYRKIVSLTGRSPNEFISTLRMDKALSLMKHKFGNVSEVALEVGYHSPSYFSRCFQKNFGCTPSEFVKAYDATRNPGSHESILL